jgi:flavin reductase (DIM6/NTAB) family NADH-FMN oxidoreductase RutF
VSRDDRPATEAHEEALQLLPAPVVVVGVARGDELGGMTASWVTRVSHVPPLLLVSIGHQRHTYTMFGDAEEFTISILAENQADVGRVFGYHSRRDRDKWAEVDHVLLGRGTPALARCSAHLLCRVRDRVRLGDHDGFVGEVVEAAVLSGPPALPLRAADFGG